MLQVYLFFYLNYHLDIWEQLGTTQFQNGNIWLEKYWSNEQPFLYIKLENEILMKY